MSIRGLIVCAAILLLCANGASAARYQRCQDGKTLVWNSLRGVAQEVSWSGLRDVNGYATGEGTLTWYRLAGVVNSYTGKMVRGKFEGPVVKEQAGTRLQANFTNGEKVGDWSEPGEEEIPPPPFSSPKKRATKIEQSPEPQEAAEEEISTPTPKPTRTPRPKTSPSPTSTPRPTPSPTPRPTPSPTPTPTSIPPATPTPRQTPIPSATPSPIRTPLPTSTPTPKPTPIATPRPTATLTPTPRPTAAVSIQPPSQLRSEPPGARSPGGFRIDQGFAPTRDSLDLALPPPRGRNVLPQAPWTGPQSVPSPPPNSQDQGASSATPAPTVAMEPTDGSKAQMIAEFKKQTTDVLEQAKKATKGFDEIQSLAAAQTLPAEVSASISGLADQARNFRTKLGYEAAMYECGAETATSEALTALDETMHDLADKNTPAGRLKLLNFFKRFPAPSRDNQKPLWRYLGSIFTSFEHARKEAETHLQRAKSLESSGKKAEALREYQEIYRIYPNAITADKITTLQSQPQK